MTLSTTCARESQDLEEEGGTGRRREGGRDIVMEEGRPGGGAHPRPPKSRLGKCFCRQNVKNHKRIASMIVMVCMKAIDWILWERQENYSVPKVISK